MTTGNDMEQRALTRVEAYAENLRHRARDGRDGTDGKTIELQAVDESRVDFLIRKIDNLEARLNSLVDNVTALEARPHVSEEMIVQLNDGLTGRFTAQIEQLVNQAMGDLRSRVVTIERTYSVPSTGQDPDSAKLTKLGQIVDSLADYVKSFEVAVDDRHDDLERRYAEIAEHIAAVNKNILNVTTETMRMKGKLLRAVTALEANEDAA